MDYVFDFPDKEFDSVVKKTKCSPCLDVTYKYEIFEDGRFKAFEGTSAAISITESIVNPHLVWTVAREAYYMDERDRQECFGVSDIKHILQLSYSDVVHKYVLWKIKKARKEKK